MAPDLTRIREILRNFGSMEDHYDEKGAWIGRWWTSIPVDSLNDEEVLELAKTVGSQPDRERSRA